MVDTLDSAALSDLIGLIYDSAVDPSGWTATLSALSKKLNFQNAGLSWIDFAAAHTLLDVSVGIDDPWRQTQHDYDAEALALWGDFEALMRYPLGEPQLMSAVAGHKAIERSAYYREWGNPQGLVDLLALPLVRSRSTLGNIALGRAGSAGPVGHFEIQSLRLLSPHFQRALTIGKLFDLQALDIHELGQTLDALATPVLLVDTGLAVVCANPAAEELLREADSLRLVQGTLSTGSDIADSALGLAVQTVTGGHTAGAGNALGIPVRRADGGGALLHVLPLMRGHLRDGLNPRASAAIFVARATHSRPPSAEALVALFGLTSSEARVCSLLVAGRTQRQVASDLQIGVGTVKTHLLRAFSKTGTNRQVDLVRLITSLGPP